VHLVVAQYISLISQKREMNDQEKEELRGQLLAKLI